MNLLNHFDKFTQSQPSLDGRQLRQVARDFLAEKGLPTRKDEDWKYTSLKILNDENFLPVGLEAAAASHEALTAIQAGLPREFINIVFYNGVFNKTLSSVEELPQGVLFVAAPQADGSTNFRDSLEALNAAYYTQKYYLKVSPDIAVDKVVNIVFYSGLETGSPLMIHPRLHLEIGERSSLKFMESYCGPKETSYFVNSQVDVELKSAAKLVYVRLQSESTRAVHVGRTDFSLSKESHLHSLVFSRGGRVSRHTLSTLLKEPSAFAVVDGVYVAKGEQVVDNTTLIDHQVGGSTTRQHYKGILADTSRGVFNGKVLIRPGAQKANSEQLNNNLLLSREAEADSKPQLEVYADDVKAGHGSTVGQLNREELFYLESRAISPEVAIPMMSYGYASELIFKLENEDLQNWLNKELREAFQGLQVTLK